jgi:hypothetical protein
MPAPAARQPRPPGRLGREFSDDLVGQHQCGLTRPWYAEQLDRFPRVYPAGPCPCLPMFSASACGNETGVVKEMVIPDGAGG